MGFDAMFEGAFRYSLSAALVMAVLTAPALAQDIGAKQAWTDLRDFARDSGLMVAARGVTDLGRSLIAEGVRIYPQGDARALLIEMPELRIESRGGARVALIPADTVTVTLRDDAERVVVLRPEGEITYELGQDVKDFGLILSALRVDLTQSTRRGVATGEALGADLVDLTGSLHVEREGTLAASLDVGDVQYSFAYDQNSGLAPTSQRGSARIEGLRLEAAATELDMLSDEQGAFAGAFDAGFSARLSLTTGSSSSDTWQAIGPQEIHMIAQSERSEMLAEAVDGAFSLSSHAGAGSFEGAFGPMQGAMTLGGMDLSLGFPLVVSADDRLFHFALSFADLLPSADLLGLINAQDFAGDAMSIALRIEADGRLTEELGPDFGTADAPPFDFSTVRLDTLDLGVGAARFTGAGAFAFLGGLMGSIDSDFPEGTGDFAFELLGGDALLTRLSTAGLIPPDQQFFARMMMNGLGRPVGEDHLRSELAIRPGGAVTVNGAPLPF